MKKFISFLFLFLFFMSFLIILNNDVVSSSATYSTDFEDGQVFPLYDYQNYFMTMEVINSVAQVSYDWPHSGYISIQSSSPVALGEYKLHFSESINTSILNEVSFYYLFTNNFNEMSDYKIKNYTGDTLLEFERDSTQICYVPNTGVPVPFSMANEGDKWYHITITYVSPIQVKYTINNGTSSETIYDTPRNIATEPKASYLHYTRNLFGITYFDDFSITVGSEIGTPSEYCDTSALLEYDTIVPTLNYFMALGSLNNRYLEFEYFTPITITCRAIEIYVSSYQLQYASLLNYYTLFINGFNIGYPSCYYQKSGDLYVLLWDNFVVQIDNAPIVIEVSCTKYWLGIYLEHFISNSDIDNDGYILQLVHNESAYVGDGIFNILQIPSGVEIYQPVYQLYYSSQSSQGDCDYDNSISTPLSNYILFGNPSHVNIAYQLDTLVDLTYITCTHNGTDFTSNSIDTFFPYLITECKGTYSFLPDETGTYVISLNRSGNIISSCTFTVSDNPDSNHFIFSYPNPSYFNEIYNLTYRYYNNGGYNGYITMSSSIEGDGLIHVIAQYPIIDNTTGTISINIPGYEKKYAYFFMHRDINGTIQSIISPHIHEYFIGGVEEDFIEVGAKTLNLKLGSKVMQSFTGTTSYIGYNVVVKSNGNIIEYITLNAFYFQHNYSQLGNYYITLEVYLNNTWVILDSDTFNIVELIEQENDFDFLSNIPEPFNYFAGCFLSISMLLFPFVILKGKLQFNTIISSIVSLICGLIGLCVSVLLGWFELWIPLFIIFITILIFVIIWLARKVGTQ